MGRAVVPDAPDLEPALFEKRAEALRVKDEAVLAVHPQVHVERLARAVRPELRAAPAQMPRVAPPVDLLDDRVQIRRQETHDAAGAEDAEALPHQSGSSFPVEVLEEVLGMDEGDATVPKGKRARGVREKVGCRSGKNVDVAPSLETVVAAAEVHPEARSGRWRRGGAEALEPARLGEGPQVFTNDPVVLPRGVVVGVLKRPEAALHSGELAPPLILPKEHGSVSR